jgi:hypothetical protein
MLATVLVQLEGHGGYPGVRRGALSYATQLLSTNRPIHAPRWQVAQAVALPLRATWIAHLGERGKQGSKWHQSDLHEAGKSPP